MSTCNIRDVHYLSKPQFGENSGVFLIRAPVLHKPVITYTARFKDLPYALVGWWTFAYCKAEDRI